MHVLAIVTTGIVLFALLVMSKLDRFIPSRKYKTVQVHLPSAPDNIDRLQAILTPRLIRIVDMEVFRDNGLKMDRLTLHLSISSHVKRLDFLEWLKTCPASRRSPSGETGNSELSVVVRDHLEVRLRMLAHRAGLGGLGALVDEPAVAAAPSDLGVLGETLPPWTLASSALYRSSWAFSIRPTASNTRAMSSNPLRGPPWPSWGTCWSTLHFRRRGRLEVRHRVADSRQRLEVQLGVLPLVACRLLENRRDLLEALPCGPPRRNTCTCCGLALARKRGLRFF